MTKTLTTGGNPPSTAAQASLYQTLRGHLAVLKLDACAEALPRVLDEAVAEKLSVTATLERLSANRGSTPPKHDAWSAGGGSPACRHRRRWTTSTSTPNPASTGP